MSSDQHIFMESRPNLILSTHFISEALVRSQVHVIYTDFSKAFDRIGHVILFYKLSSKGLSIMDQKN